MTPMTVKQAAARIGVSKQRVHALMMKGRISVVSRTGQHREAGRFAAGAAYLNGADVEREAKARGR